MEREPCGWRVYQLKNEAGEGAMTVYRAFSGAMPRAAMSQLERRGSGFPVVKSFGQGGASMSVMCRDCWDSRNIRLKTERGFTPFNCLYLLKLKLGRYFWPERSAVWD